MAFSVSTFFRSDESGAISAMYAIAILPLVVMAGVAFDYSRLMSMDSELQNAADQAALAAATQLNAHDGAMADAEGAARNFFINETRASAGDRPITELAINFYEAEFDDEGNVVTDSPLDKTDSDNDVKAQVVEVTVLNRRVRYALTPVMGRLFSGDVNAKAKAMLDQSTCNVAPLMFCAPSKDFASDDSYIGDTLAIRLRDKATAESELPTDAPGNFGFLDIDYDSKPNTRLGLNTQSGVCVGGRIESDTGNVQVEAQYFNTRFERYENSAKSAKCDADGNFCASENVRQGFVQVQAVNVSGSEGDPFPDVKCANKPTANDKWDVVPDATYPIADCLKLPWNAGGCSFASGNPTNAQWANYNTAVHKGSATFSFTDADTRWEAFKKERDTSGGRDPTRVKQAWGNNGKLNNYCSYPDPVKPGNVFDPGETDKDRRVLTVAAADCTDLKGKGVVKILRWVDLFMVDSARQVGSYHQFIGEVMGPGTPPGGGTGFQKFGRGKAVLVQ